MSQSAPAEFTSLSSLILHAMATTDAAVVHASSVSPRARRLGLVASALPVFFLAMDATMKVLQLAPAMDGTAALGYPVTVVLPLGVLQLACLVLYLWPRTSVLGAILWTGYLGGAVATHVRLGNPLFTHVLFPVVVGALLWLGLWLRDARVRRLLPLS